MLHMGQLSHEPTMNWSLDPSFDYEDAFNDFFASHNVSAHHKKTRSGGQLDLNRPRWLAEEYDGHGSRISREKP